MEHVNNCRSHAFVNVAKLGTTEWKFLFIGESPGKPTGNTQTTLDNYSRAFLKITFIGVTLVNRIQGHF